MSVLEEYKRNEEKRELYRVQLDGWRRQRTQEVALAQERRMKEEALTEKQQAMAREQQALTEKQQALTEKQQAMAREQQALAEKQQALAEAEQLRLLLKKLGIDPQEK